METFAVQIFAVIGIVLAGCYALSSPLTILRYLCGTLVSFFAALRFFDLLVALLRYVLVVLHSIKSGKCAVRLPELQKVVGGLLLLAWIVFVRDETSWLGHFTFATYQSWLVIGFLFLIESVEQKLQRTLKDHTVVFRKIYKNAGLLAAINGVLGSDCDALTAKRNLAQALSKSLGRPFGVGRKPKLDLAHVERLLILTRGGKLTEGIAVHKLAPYLFEHVECLVAADGESFDLAARRAIRQGKVLLIDREVTCREDRVVSKPLIAKTEVTVGTNEELVVAATLWCALGHQYWRLPLVEHLGIWVQGGKLELRNIAIGPARGQLTGSDIGSSTTWNSGHHIH